MFWNKAALGALSRSRPCLLAPLQPRVGVRARRWRRTSGSPSATLACGAPSKPPRPRPAERGAGRHAGKRGARGPGRRPGAGPGARDRGRARKHGGAGALRRSGLESGLGLRLQLENGGERFCGGGSRRSTRAVAHLPAVSDPHSAGPAAASL